MSGWSLPTQTFLVIIFVIVRLFVDVAPSLFSFFIIFVIFRLFLDAAPLSTAANTDIWHGFYYYIYQIHDFLDGALPVNHLIIYSLLLRLFLDGAPLSIAANTDI